MEFPDSLRSRWPEQRMRASARERILRVLAATQRPLRWAELTSALARSRTRCRAECEWLMDHGYIAPVRMRDDAARAGEALWTFGDRGLVLGETNGARPDPRCNGGLISPLATTVSRQPAAIASRRVAAGENSRGGAAFTPNTSVCSDAHACSQR